MKRPHGQKPNLRKLKRRFEREKLIDEAFGTLRPSTTAVVREMARRLGVLKERRGGCG